MGVGLKICGVTRAQDLRACHEAGVDAVGINLWSGSPRYRTVDAAEQMLGEAALPRDVLRVGVFVDPEPEEIGTARSRLALDLIQLHGDRAIGEYAALGHDYVWVIRGTPPLDELQVPGRPPKWVLLDSRVRGFGGAGTRTDWEWARRAVGHLAPLPVWLAGGLSPENSARALAAVQPAGLDVASGAEVDGARRGEKDPAKIAALVAICKNHPSS